MLYSFFITSWPLAGGLLRGFFLINFLDFGICSQKPILDCGVTLCVAVALGNEDFVFQHVKCLVYCGFPFFIGSLILTYIFSDIRSHVVVGKPFVMLLIGLFLDLTLDNLEGRELAVNLLELVVLRRANSSGLFSKRTIQNNEVFIKIQMDRGSHPSHNRIFFLFL